MQKLYAFNLYTLNENFVASVPVGNDGERRGVYLSSDVDALLKAIKRELDDDDASVARRMIDIALMVK